MPEQTEETPVLFNCGGAELVGILHAPRAPETIGVVIVTGGPQYRVGSHRQFVQVARRLADAGIPVLRFDYRGMGDSDGESVSFENAHRDIEAAIDCLIVRLPTLKKVVLWGLCDAASALMMYGHLDDRVVGMVLLNPWVRTERGQAKALITHYYARRLLSPGFWMDLVKGKLSFASSLSSLAANVRQAATGATGESTSGIPAYIARMESGLAAFNGSTLFIVSGDDLTAAEFVSLVNASKSWHNLLQRANCIVRNIPEANHTFSTAEWRSQVEEWTLDWVKRL